MSASVLFDAPGPRTRRLTLVGNVVATAAVLGVLAWILLQMNAKGQLDPGLWLAATSADAWQYYYVPGLVNTLRAAAFATVGAVVFGLLFGMGRLAPNVVMRALCGIVVEFFRAVPVLIMMVFFYSLFAATLGPEAENAFLAVVVALVLYNGSVIAELVRSGVGNLPRGQGEAGLAIGLTPGQTLWSIQLPQALVAMLPAVVSQLVVVLKDSALGQLISYAELLSAGRVLWSAEQNPLQVLFVVAVTFIVINWLLTQLAHLLAKRLSSRTAAVPIEGGGIGDPAAAAVAAGGPGSKAGGPNAI